MSARTSPAGMRVGKLTVGNDRELRKSHAYWKCACDCGASTWVRADRLIHGYTRSCGCLASERMTRINHRHGLCANKLHSIWREMMRRCYDERCVAYPHYGGRGIDVCPQWHDAAAFIEALGSRPEGLTIDRIDNDRGYWPDNIRWATRAEQSRNRRTCIHVTLQGQSKPLKEWCAELGIPYRVVIDRRHLGWSNERALTTPYRARAA